MSWKNLILIILVLLASVDLTAGYLTLEWMYNTGGGINDIYVSDLDGDGNKEVIAGSYDGMVYAFDKKGNLIWKQSMLCSVYSVYAADLDSDGNKEVISGSCRQIYALNSSGDLGWKFTTNGEIKSLFVEDLDNNGDKELMAGSDSGQVNMFYVIDHEGNSLWKETFRGAFPQGIYAKGLDDDGSKEIIVGAGAVFAFDRSGNKKWTYKTTGNVAYISAIDKEIFVGSYPYIYVLNADGTLKWEYKTSGIVESIYATDLDNNGNNEIIAGSDMVYVFDKDGNLIWNYNTSSEIHSIYAEDLDNDGYKEIIVGSDDIYILNKDGNLEWKYQTYRSVTKVQAVDLEGDGYNEIVAGSMDRNVYVFKVREMNPKEQQNKTEVKGVDVQQQEVTTTVPKLEIETTTTISKENIKNNSGIDYSVYIVILIVLSLVIFLLRFRRR